MASIFDEIGLLIPPSPLGDQELYFCLKGAELGSSILTVDPVKSTGRECFFEVSHWFDDRRAREKNVDVTRAQYGELRGIVEILTIEMLRPAPDDYYVRKYPHVLQGLEDGGEKLKVIGH